MFRFAKVAIAFVAMSATSAYAAAPGGVTHAFASACCALGACCDMGCC